MSDPRQGFVAHRCPQRPRYVSIRNYGHFPWFMRYLGSDSDWILAKCSYDVDYDCDELNEFGTISFCPYCGKRLEVAGD